MPALGWPLRKVFVAEGAKVLITGRNKATLEAAAKELGPERARGRRRRDRYRRQRRRAEAGGGKIRQAGHVVFANAGIAGPYTGRWHHARGVRECDQDQSHFGVLHGAVGAAASQRQGLDHPERFGDFGARHSRPIGLCRGQGRRSRDGALDGVGTVAARLSHQRRIAPGATRTAIWGAAVATPEAEKAFEKRIAMSTPLGRLGRESIRWRRRCCSSPPTMPRMCRGRNCSLMAVPRRHQAARRSIADKSFRQIIESGSAPSG